jgi:hypothetical protein
MKTISSRRFVVLFLLVIFVIAGILLITQRKHDASIVTNATSISVSDIDNGKTITVSRGTKIQVTLHSSYWNFGSIDTKILRHLKEPLFTPDPSVSYPGSGAGALVVEYQTVGIGKTIISASRVSCGEALRCSGNQGNYFLHIIVN